MNIKQQKQREALLMMLTPNNERDGLTLAEAKATAAALDALGFGPVDVSVTPLVAGVIATHPFPVSEVERYNFEDEQLNYSGSSPQLQGFNLAGRLRLLQEPPETAFQRIFDEEFIGATSEKLKDAKLAFPGVQAAVLSHIQKSLKLAFPPTE